MGKALWSIENVSIILCERTREDCEFPTNQGEQRDCALEFTHAGWDALQELEFERDLTKAPQGEIWIEGVGRKSTRPGSFGHMSAHSCQVLFDDVVTVDRGEPWFFEPPPAHE